jgi:thiamine transport system ATP-binding protein
MLDLVKAITAETRSTLLVVTHDPRDAERIADLTSLVAEGRVAPPVPTAELFADPPAALRDYLGK